MDFDTPIRRPLEARVKLTNATYSSVRLSTEPNGLSALTDAPMRNTEKRTAFDLHTDARYEHSAGMSDSPAVERLINGLTIACTSPLPHLGADGAERQLDLTISPKRAGQKRNRESESDSVHLPETDDEQMRLKGAHVEVIVADNQP